MFLIWSKSNKKKLIGKLDYFININGIRCITHKKMFDLIRSVNCNFLSQVKGNTSALLQKIQLFTRLTTPCSTCEYYQENNGYQITRHVELYYNIID